MRRCKFLLIVLSSVCRKTTPRILGKEICQNDCRTASNTSDDDDCNNDGEFGETVIIIITAAASLDEQKRFFSVLLQFQPSTGAASLEKKNPVSSLFVIITAHAYRLVWQLLLCTGKTPTIRKLITAISAFQHSLSIQYSKSNA